MLDELEVVFISYNGVGLADCINHSWCDVFLAAWADACNNDFSHATLSLIGGYIGGRNVSDSEQLLYVYRYAGLQGRGGEAAEFVIG